MDIQSIVEGKKILFNLDPIQSAYIGREYYKYLYSKNIKNKAIGLEINPDIKSRYGTYEVLSLDIRTGSIIFSDLENGNKITMSPKNICRSFEFISRFDSSQAFYIGYHAELSIKKYPETDINMDNLIDFKSRKVSEVSKNIQ